MRSLAQGVYTHDQVLTQLRDTNTRVGTRFDVCDRVGSVIGTLPVGDDGVMLDTATVEYNGDNDIKSQFRCEMRANESLRGQTFKRLLRPSFVVKMPDGGSVAYPLGEFVWVTPERSVWTGDETWTVLLGDKTQLLDYGGPGPGGFTATSGSWTNVVINQAMTQAGFPADEQVPQFSVTIDTTVTWSITTPRQIKKWETQASRLSGSSRASDRRRAKRIQKKIDSITVENSPTTWLAIINKLTSNAGYDELWFNYAGQPVVEASYDPGAAIIPEFVFDCSPQGMLASRIETSPDYGGVANRIIVYDSSGTKAPLAVDANVYYPAHPLSQANTGVYIDDVLDNAGSSNSRLQSGKKRLAETIGVYETVTFDALLHPGVELFDVIAVQIPGDAEYSGIVPLQIRQIQLNPDVGTMSLQCQRLYSA